MINYLLCFLISGSVITFTTLLSEKGHSFLGGILMVLPNMSLLAFYYINKTAGMIPTMQALKSSLLGTVFIWPAYMLLLLLLMPKIGVNKSLLAGVALSLALAVAFIFICKLDFIRSWLNS